MPTTLEVIRQKDCPQPDLTGEGILDKSFSPYKVWVPGQRLVVLGNSQDPYKELNVENVVADSVPVYRRIGGGGTVLLDDSCLCIALRMRKRGDWAIADYFATGNRLVQEVVFSSFGIKTECLGVSDLCVEERKIMGSSLYLPRQCALFLASLLVCDNREAIAKYLAHPSSEPDYRKGRRHADFISSLTNETELFELQAETVGAMIIQQLQTAEWCDILDYK